MSDITPLELMHVDLYLIDFTNNILSFEVDQKQIDVMLPTGYYSLFTLRSVVIVETEREFMKCKVPKPGQLIELDILRRKDHWDLNFNLSPRVKLLPCNYCESWSYKVKRLSFDFKSPKLYVTKRSLTKSTRHCKCLDAHGHKIKLGFKYGSCKIKGSRGEILSKSVKLEHELVPENGYINLDLDQLRHKLGESGIVYVCYQQPIAAFRLRPELGSKLSLYCEPPLISINPEPQQDDLFALLWLLAFAGLLVVVLVWYLCRH